MTAAFSPKDSKNQTANNLSTLHTPQIKIPKKTLGHIKGNNQLGRNPSDCALMFRICYSWNKKTIKHLIHPDTWDKSRERLASRRWPWINSSCNSKNWWRIISMGLTNLMRTWISKAFTMWNGRRPYNWNHLGRRRKTMNFQFIRELSIIRSSMYSGAIWGKRKCWR